MNRSIAIAYTVAAAATAIALVVIVGSTVGFEDEADEAGHAAEEREHVAQAAPAPLDPNLANREAAADEPVIVYEDAPPTRGHRDDDEEEEDDEHEEHERREHEGRERHERDDD